jgi:hypothetical protein
MSTWGAHAKIAANAKSLIDGVGKTECDDARNSRHKRALVNVLSRDLPAQQAADILGVNRGYVWHSRKGDFDAMKSDLVKARYPTLTTRAKVGKVERACIASFLETHTFTPSGSATARHILEDFRYKVYANYRCTYVKHLRMLVREGLRVRSSVRDLKRKPTILEMNILALESSDRTGAAVTVAAVGEGWADLKLSPTEVNKWKLRPRDKDTFWAIAKEEVAFISSKKSQLL